jgi:hypothetical protein
MMIASLILLLAYLLFFLLLLFNLIIIIFLSLIYLNQILMRLSDSPRKYSLQGIRNRCIT